MVSSNEDRAYYFDRCEVRVGARELLVDGVVQAVTPKVFDLLVHLLAERHRAVSKEDLITAVWQGAALTDSVLARTVMLARRLLGDDATEPTLIRNVHGFGYRFVGHVTETARVSAIPTKVDLSAPTAEPPRGTTRADAVRRLGLLPLNNLAEDKQLAWAQVGLIALVGHAIERDSRLAVQALGAEYQAGIEGVSAAPAEAAQKARELLGLDWVVHTVLRKQADGLWLDYEIFSGSPSAFVGSLRDTDLLALGERLAQAIATQILDENHSSGPLLSTDPFVNQAYARAMAFLDVQNWHAGAALLGAAAVLEPSLLLLELERARALMWMQDPRVVEMAENILQHLGPEHEPRLHSRAHDLMSLSLQMRGHPVAVPRIEAHRQQSMQFCSTGRPADWKLAMQINGGNYHLDGGRYEEARRCLEHVADQARALGNQVLLALALQNCAIADRAQGDLERARQRLEEALRIWHRLPKRPMRAHALMQLAAVNQGLGLLDVARLQTDEALGCIDLNRLRGYEAATASNICLMYLELGMVDPLSRVATHFEGTGLQGDRHRVLHSAVMACTAQANGELDAARQHLWEVVRHCEPWPGVNYRRNWLLALLQLEMAFGDVRSLAAVREAMEQAVKLGNQPELRAGVGRSHAAELHLEGDSMHALAVLSAVVYENPPGKASNMARFDAAWLHLERGQVDEAGALMNVSRAWRDGHPTGMAALARWHAAEGRFGDAYTWQQRALAGWPCQPHASHVALAQLYAKAGDARRDDKHHQALPLLPRLLSATWIPGVVAERGLLAA